MTTFLSADRLVAVDIEREALEEMIAISTGSGRLETGGVLLGRYGEFGDRVVVSRVTGPPPDSKRYARAFIRGVVGLSERLSQVWREGIYYVGEWHLHPAASPKPSETDQNQQLEFSREADHRCPHPVLVVLGGSRPDWLLSVGVVLDGSFVPLALALEPEPEAASSQTSAQGLSKAGQPVAKPGWRSN
jgi:integrative and conjugative element protein (TIGR02256 family)